MYNLDDTIAAISTPPGEGGIGIVRVSGGDSINVVGRIFRAKSGKNMREFPSHSIHYGWIIDPSDGNPVDEVLLTVMRAPKTYTREDVVEINCHGGMLPLRKILSLLLGCGVRLAGPGEFTFRAFMNGRIDLAQAEAVMDLIRAKTERSGKIAALQLKGGLSDRVTSLRDGVLEVLAIIEAYIDFPEEDLEGALTDDLLKRITRERESLQRLADSYEEGRLFREGISIAIVGRPNVGKSSLLNALLKEDRAIVTEVPGTTRDLIEEPLSLNGIPLRVIDTAGIRKADDLAEKEGVSRSIRALEGADMVLGVFDLSEPLREEDRQVIERLKGRNTVIVLNKMDLEQKLSEKEFQHLGEVVKISAKTGEGLESLKKRIEGIAIGEGRFSEGVLVTNLRHKKALDIAVERLRGFEEKLKEGAPLEILAIELREAVDSLGEVVGEVTTDDLLEKIFNRFCIGK